MTASDRGVILDCHVSDHRKALVLNSNIQSIEDRVGQMLMAGFHGLTAPDYFLDWLRTGRLGSVILFARNVESPAQLAALTTQLHEAAKYPLLIAIDQEGGTVSRMRDFFTESPGAMALASIGENAEAVTEEVSGILAREMQALGINWTFAPVVDISYNADNPTVGTRSFGSDHERVATLAAAAVRGFQANGVAACAKHFPGLGATAVDTHLALPKLDTDVSQLLKVDLLPYREAIAAGLASVMTTHTIFTTLDEEHPATLSEKIIVPLLREELGFEGVVTTDCMEMKAIDDHYHVSGSVVRAAQAGVDIIIFSHTAEKQSTAYDHLLAAVKRGDVTEAQVDAANTRVAALKARFPAQPVDIAQVYTTGHRDSVLSAAQAALTTLRTESDVLPLNADDSRRIILVEFASAVISEVQDDKAKTSLGSFISARLPNIETVTVPTTPDDSEISATMSRLRAADVVILATRNAHLNSAQAKAVRIFSDTDAHVILLALRNPYDVSLIDGGTVICAAGDSLPSLEAVSAVLTGEIIPSGRLPVEV
jgi:beta-N-acetylhexosaminidase